MNVLLTYRAHASGLLASAVLLGCAEVPQDEGAVQVSAQQLRAGPAAEVDSVYLGLDLLATGDGNRAIPCGEGELELAAEYSTSGADGPYVALPDDALQIRCGALEGGDFALVVDNSGSEEGFLQALRQAATLIINRILPAGGRASLVRVSTNADVVTPLTDERSELEAGLHELHVSNGWTALYDGIRMGNETLGGASIGWYDVERYDDASAFCSASHKLGIIAITDGRENNSSHQRHWSQRYPGDGLDTTLEDLFDLKVDGITTPIYTVGLGDDADHEALTELALHTGGRHKRIDHRRDIASTFEVIADYAQAEHQLCAEFPVDTCGPLHVRVSFEWRHGNQRRADERLYRLDVPCAETGSEIAGGLSPRGNFATLLFTMSDPGLPRDMALQLADQMVRWTSPVTAPRVLVVLDDNHHGEDAGDADYVTELLREAGHDVDLIDEPAEGLSRDALEGYDVVWLSNPGYPTDDAATIDQLLLFSHEYGGVVLQGDDMAWGYGHAYSMTPATGLDFVDNGVTYCGRTIDNYGDGRYQVTFDDAGHPATAGLSGLSFDYGNDIDTTVVASPTATVLAWATTRASEGECAAKPAIVVYSP